MTPEDPHVDPSFQMLLTWDGSTDSPEWPAKIELVSDGTSKTPTVNVTNIITACTEYSSCSSSRSPGGHVRRNRVRKRSNTKMNAFAMTGMNEYWMKALSQPQNTTRASAR